MNYQTLTTAIVIMLILFTTGCSVFERAVYHPDINQGNYLTPTDVSKIHTGMTKQQVIYILGTSMVKDPFGSNTWYYIFRRKPSHESVTQQTLTLTFDNCDTLINIHNKSILENTHASK
ncbi:outer membrane protein assembly factor BamE [Sodalis endosymbiont of Henestaris halophilus]|uniref:outer membrane protein assembly factor BamE n=1 Tax=Sodalis endosymbiont of Henestaris halophilus TaxID=1929246 RepID=UPI000BC0EFD1|nr:outer membrane protein assembly factor BamE [Sodalis endosymbiont of Henestaris halophilus]SNC58950.1 Outer membrane protein assembly factor BamE precursor [Sodalis endosymbiont of Henestaris halophilus]